MGCRTRSTLRRKSCFGGKEWDDSQTSKVLESRTFYMGSRSAICFRHIHFGDPAARLELFIFNTRRTYLVYLHPDKTLRSLTSYLQAEASCSQGV